MYQKTEIRKQKSEFILFSVICLLSSVFCLLILGCSPSLDDAAFIYKKTSEHYDNALAKNPDNINLRIKLAQFYYRFNDYEKVEELLTGIPENQAQIILAKTKAKLKDYTHALELFNKVGEIDDAEYTYLYAYTCEQKNLFPQAVPLYEKVEEPFKELAKARLKEIGIKIEEGMPSYIKDLLNKQDSFLSTLTEDEAVILLVDEDIEVTKQNTTTSSIHIIEKVLQERGKSIGEVKIGYDSTYERVELEFARTITPDGKVVYAGKENLRDVSKYMNFPLYSNAHLFIISMPSVEVGSIIEYKLKLYSSKLIDDDNFTFIYRLKERFPVAKASFKLTIPKEKDISLRFLNQEYSENFNLKPKKDEAQSKKIYLWQFSQIPAIVPEEKMPPYSEINPAIIMSSFSSWQQFYLWWHDLFKDKLTLSNDIKEFLKDLLEGAKSDLEKAKRIYEFCSRDIRYVGVEYGESGYEPHKAEEVYWNRYGDCKDKATLLVALMREAGLKAYPVLIPTRDVYPIDKDKPSVNFNHAIAAIDLKGELIFMDATSSTTSFGNLPLDDQQRKVLVFFPDKYEIIDTPLLRNSEVVYQTDIKISNDEDAQAKRELIAKGAFASIQRYYFKNTHPQTIEEDIQERIAQISPFSKLIDYEVKNKDDFDKFPILKYTFNAKQFLNPANNLRIIPLINDIDIDPGFIGKERREYPIDFSGLFKRASEVNISLPSGLSAKYVPQDKEINTEWFDFSSEYKKGIKTINIRRIFDIKKRTVAKEDYQKFKEELEKVFYILKEEVILEK